jgi:CIC family chloride channel protein
MLALPIAMNQDNASSAGPPVEPRPTVATATRPPPEAVAAAPEPRPLGLLRLCALSIVVGSITGLGAVVFRDLIGLVHNVLFSGLFRVAYDSSQFTPPPPWGAWVILVPVLGGVAVTFLVSTFAPEAKGHGVPEVMDAIYYQRGIIRPVVAVVKSLASALAIGSGAAVGREGPIIQIGAALGSTLGQVIGMRIGERIVLVAAGAGAGIAATFNTPIGGVLFATELMLPEISASTFMPVAIATGTATLIGRLFFGAQPAFTVPANLGAMPETAVGGLTALILYAVLGAAVGVAATGFIRGLHWAEDGFDRIPGRYLRHAIGMLLVGAMMYAFMRFGGHYYVEGVGYSTIQALLTGGLAAPMFLLLLYVAKLAATSISLGSGSSGGVFSPSLFMGATLGAAFAGLIHLVLPGLPVAPAAFAMVGMGAMVGGGTGAAMTAVTMIFEMTRDYEIVLPMILAVAVALGVRRLLSRENIYTIKLVRRGHVIPKALHANMFMVRLARDVMERDVLVLDEATPFSRFLEMSAAAGGMRYVVVTRAGAIVGALRVNTDLRRAIGAADSKVLLGELANSRFVTVAEDAVAFDVIAGMWRAGATMAVVVGPQKSGEPRQVLGVISKEHVADAVAASVEIYPPH